MFTYGHSGWSNLVSSLGEERAGEWSTEQVMTSHDMREIWPTCDEVFNPEVNNRYYSTLKLPWKLWFVKSVQSIYNSMWSWYDNPISVADIGLSCWVESLPSFQAPCLCSALQLLQTQRKVSSFADCLKRYNKTIIDFWFSHDIMNYQILCLCYLLQPNQILLRPQRW